jgi:hypothetical protein
MGSWKQFFIFYFLFLVWVLGLVGPPQANGGGPTTSYGLAGHPLVFLKCFYYFNFKLFLKYK